MSPLQLTRLFTQHRVAAIAVVGVLAAGTAWWQSDAWATPPAAEAPPAGEAPTAVPADETVVPPPQVDPTKAQITFTTYPPAKATVFWGKTRLGRIMPRQPLVVVRPRDSGPLDVVIRAPGYLPVQTRAHTWADNKLMVKLTRFDQKATLPGYRQPLDAGEPLGSDGGVPETLSDMPPSLAGPAPAPTSTPAQPAQPQPVQPQPVQPQPVQPQPAQPAAPVAH